MTVAVLDTGVDVRHPDLDDNAAAAGLAGCHVVDATGHGTHVAGIVAAEHHDPPATNQDVAGVAPDAEILSLRVLKRDTCTISPAPVTPPVAVARAVNDGARIVNMSLSGSARQDTDDLEAGGIAIPSTDTYELVLRAASMLGVVVVAAAGNCGDDEDVTIGGETKKGWEWNKCSEHNAKRRPALYPDAIAVAAVNHDATRSSFSTANEHVDIAAPGGKGPHGRAILSTDRCTHVASPSNPALQCGTTTMQGTSMAAPFVAGVVAHMINRHPQATVGQVRRALEATVAAPPAPVDKKKYPEGSWTRRGRINDPPFAPPSREYGFGIVDPAEAVARLGEIVAGVEAADAGGFEAVAAGGRFSCGLRSSGRVRCWGRSGASAGAPASARTGFVALDAGHSHTCAITQAGTDSDFDRDGGPVTCWGDNTFGQAGAPSGSFTQVSAGRRHSCGRRPDATVVCWGSDLHGQAPQARLRTLSVTRDGTNLITFNPDVTDYSIIAEPGQADAPAGSFSAIAAGGYHSCGIKTDAGVVCWGSNFRGQTDAPSGSFTAVSSGYEFSCGLRTDSTVACWGSNSDGQTDAPEGSFSAVSSGYFHSCGTRSGGRIECWPGPLDEPAGSFSAIAAGSFHSCGIRTDRTVVCWGDNHAGQTDAPAGSFSSVSAGDEHSCGIRTDSTAVCWGARSSALEPAASVTLGFRVTSRAARWVYARYEVTIARPEPVRERTSRAARQQLGASGAGARSEPGAPCEETADLRQCLGAWPECRQDPAGCSGLRTGDSPGAAGNAITEPGTDSGPASAPTDTSSPRSGADADTADSATHQGTAVACPAPPTDAAGSDAIVTVADATLRAGINRFLDKAPDAAVTASEMAGLAALALPARAGGGRVVSLSGLEHAANLASLDLNGHNVADVSPLACLDRLTTVDLAGNDITDLAALSGLSGLTTLGLAGNDIADIAALSGLSALEALDVSGNDIAAVGPLGGLSGLRSLNVGHNEISDITALRGLTALEALHAHGNQITGVAALAPLTSLTSLYLDHNAITGVAALSSLTRLTTLGLGGNQISDITALRGLTALETLYLFDNDVADASALSGLNSLKVLWVDGNDLTGPYRWAPTGGLGYLDARHNLIADIAPLDAAGATGGTVHTEPQRVATVRVNDASLRAALLAALGKTAGDTLSPEEIAAIERLQRAGPASDPAPITDLSGLEHATALTVLRLRNNNIADIGPIAGLSGLTELDLHTNNITDLTPLDNITGLTIHGRNHQTPRN